MGDPAEALRLAGASAYVLHAAYVRKHAFLLVAWAREKQKTLIFHPETILECDKWLSILEYNGCEVYTVKKEGFLSLKKSSATPYFFVLYCDTLRWYREPSVNHEPLGVLPFGEQTSVLIDLDETHAEAAQTLTIVSVGRKPLVLFAPDKEARDSWVDALELRTTRTGKKGYLWQDEATRFIVQLSGNCLRFRLKEEFDVALVFPIRAGFAVRALVGSGGGKHVLELVSPEQKSVKFLCGTQLQQRQWKEALDTVIAAQQVCLELLLVQAGCPVSVNNTDGSPQDKWQGSVRQSEDGQAYLNRFYVADSANAVLTAMPNGPALPKSHRLTPSMDLAENFTSGLADLTAYSGDVSDSVSASMAAPPTVTAAPQNRVPAAASAVALARAAAVAAASTPTLTPRPPPTSHPSASLRSPISPPPPPISPQSTSTDITPSLHTPHPPLRPSPSPPPRPASPSSPPTTIAAATTTTNTPESSSSVGSSNLPVVLEAKSLQRTSSSTSSLERSSPSTSLTDLSSLTASSEPSVAASSCPSLSRATSSTSPSSPLDLLSASDPADTEEEMKAKSAAQERLDGLRAHLLKKGFSPETFAKLTVTLDKQSASPLTSPKADEKTNSLENIPTTTTPTIKLADEKQPPKAPPLPPSLRSTMSLTSFPSYAISPVVVEDPPPLPVTELANVDDYVLTFYQIRDNDPLNGENPRSPAPKHSTAKTATMKGPRDGEGTLAGGYSLRDVLGGTVPNLKRKTLLQQFLLQACNRGDLTTAKVLVMALGFDGFQTFRDKQGLTPLLAAAGQGHVQVVRLLLEELKVDLAIPNPLGATAFQLAAQTRHKEVVQYFGEALMKLGLAAQALSLLGHSAAQVYSLALHQLMVREPGGAKAPNTRAPVSAPVSFQLLEELALLRSSGSVRSTRIKAIKVKIQATGLPMRHKRFGGAQPNPVLCVLLGDGADYDFNFQYATKTRSPRFPTPIVYSPVFPRRVEQYMLLGLFDDSPHGLLSIGFARIALQDFVGLRDFPFALTQFSGSDAYKKWFQTEEPSKIELQLESEVVHNSLVEQVEITVLKHRAASGAIDKKAVLSECGVVAIEADLNAMLDKCAQCNFIGRKIDCLLGLDSDASAHAALFSHTHNLRLNTTTTTTTTTTAATTNTRPSISTSVSSSSLNARSNHSLSFLSSSHVSSADLSSLTRAPSPSSAITRDFHPSLTAIPYTRAPNPTLTRSTALTTTTAAPTLTPSASALFTAPIEEGWLAFNRELTPEEEIVIAQQLLQKDDKWDGKYPDMPILTEALHEARRRCELLRIQKSEDMKLLASTSTGNIVAVFQGICNKVADHRATSRDLVRVCQNAIMGQKLRVRILTSFMEKLELLVVNLKLGIPAAADEWPSAERPDLGLDINSLSFASSFMSLSLQSGLAKSRQLVSQRFSELQYLGESTTEIPPPAFRLHLMETIVMAVWLQRDIESSLTPSVRSLLQFLGSVKQELTTELEGWEVQKDFYSGFHPTLYGEVRAVGLDQLKKLQREQKSLRHKLHILEAEALRVELLDPDAQKVYIKQQQVLAEVGVSAPFIDPRSELTSVKQKNQVIEDEIEYLKNTFVDAEEQKQVEAGARLDTVWYIPPSSIEISGKIGSGQYGDVFKGTLRSAPVALKVYKDGSDSFVKEFALWKELRDPHVIQLLGYSKIKDQLAMIMPFCETSLDSFLKTCPPLTAESAGSVLTHPSWRVRSKIALQVASGMAYLHEANVMHRDLKSANVLLQGDGRDARICDFGFSKKTSWARSMSASGKGSPYTMAPEVYLSGQSSTAADVYSFGIVLWEIIYCSTPYTNLRIDMPEPAFMDLIKNGSRPLVVPEDCMPPLIRQYHALLTQCWQHKAASRPTFRDVSKHLLDLHEGRGADLKSA